MSDNERNLRQLIERFPDHHDSAWAIAEIDRDRARIFTLEEALKHLVSASKEPTMESMGFDHPPECLTAEDDALARALFEANEVLRGQH